MRRLVLTLALLLIPLAGFAQDEEAPGIDIIDVSGPLDSSALEFMRNSIESAAESGQVLAVLQVNSPAVLDRDSWTSLMEVVENPPLPLAIWVGPAPAVAYGGAGHLVLAAEKWALSPGSEVSIVSPTIAGEEETPLVVGHPSTVSDAGVSVQPSIRQYLQSLNGQTLQTADGPVVVETLEPFETGVTLKTVTFREPGLGTKFFRLAVTPEAAFFFLVVGLTIVSFEFFAIGPGVAAGVATVSLLLAGWGIVNLPIRWWALTLAILGWIALTVAYQRGGVLAITLLGAVSLQVGGMFYVHGSGQIDPRWYLVLPSVLAALFFFLLAMPTVQRARFSTQTIGRDSLVGESGMALQDFDPDGVVEVHGARWRATAHREAGVAQGTAVVVTGVDGMFLEVDLPSSEREN